MVPASCLIFLGMSQQLLSYITILPIYCLVHSAALIISCLKSKLESRSLTAELRLDRDSSRGPSRASPRRLRYNSPTDMRWGDVQNYICKRTLHIFCVELNKELLSNRLLIEVRCGPCPTLLPDPMAS